MDRLRKAPLLGRLAVGLLLAASRLTMAYDLDPDSPESIKSVSKDMAADLMSFYHGHEPGGTPGLLPYPPYYWWETGAMLGAFIDYWYYTGDDTYNDIVTQALLFQVGEDQDYMPRNQTRTEGNDDQGFWGLTVMSAAEYNYPDPPADQPQWLALAQAVFNTQAARWETQHCGGGLRWQIFTWNAGYDYKNSISQACFFALGARLALYTGNQSYADWAEKTWDWMVNVNLINTTDWSVYDGIGANNCTDITIYQFSYNVGGMILGASAMYNLTESRKWKDRLDHLLQGSNVFFTGPKNDIMYEAACETVHSCNTDEQSFKAYLTRWLTMMTKWAPHTYNTIMPKLRASSLAAARLCQGGDNKRMCGLIWWNGTTYDNTTGVGQQMASMEIVLSNLILNSSAPVTANNGGTSKGNPGGGGSDTGRIQPSGPGYKPINGGDRFGAAILTVFVAVTVIGTIAFVCLDETSTKGPVAQLKGFYSTISAAIAALAAGGGIAAAAAAGRRRSDKNKGIDISEKSAANNGDGDSATGSNNVFMDAAPAAFDSVRHSGVSQRRLSNMPLGWPHNASVRNSVVVGESSSTGASAEDQQQR
ncbi:glycosyl hydrolase family 76 domain-containing protein [Trichoderma barbatum]